MSLFSFDEICKDCKWAVWHWCCHNAPHFCHCEAAVEQYVDHYRGKCESKVLKEEKKSEHQEIKNNTAKNRRTIESISILKDRIRDLEKEIAELQAKLE